MQYEIAQGLDGIGLEAGEKVAWIRPRVFDETRSYDWAHLAQLRIIAEIPGTGETDFWSSPPSVQAKVVSKFKEAGARAVIATEVLGVSPLPWKPVGTTGYYVLFLAN